MKLVVKCTASFTMEEEVTVEDRENVETVLKDKALIANLKETFKTEMEKEGIIVDDFQTMEAMLI